MAENSVKTGGIVRLCSYDWRVLDINNAKALVISDRILMTREYGSSSSWGTCDLNTYLNGQFYEESFSPEEKSLIAKTDRLGKLFILSVEELVRYFGDSGQLASGMDYINDEYNQSRIAVKADNNTPSWWWLRVDFNADNLAMCVGDDGCVYVTGHGITVEKAGAGGVRPAFWLNLV